VATPCSPVQPHSLQSPAITGAFMVLVAIFIQVLVQHSSGAGLLSQPLPSSPVRPRYWIYVWSFGREQPAPSQHSCQHQVTAVKTIGDRTWQGPHLPPNVETIIGLGLTSPPQQPWIGIHYNNMLV